MYHSHWSPQQTLTLDDRPFDTATGASAHSQGSLILKVLSFSWTRNLLPTANANTHPNAVLLDSKSVADRKAFLHAACFAPAIAILAERMKN
jgi:hypothetical protein